MARRSAWAAALLALVAGPLAAQPREPVPLDAALGSGPYPAVMRVDPGLGTHTVYHPADLAALGTRRLPIVAWGNGACIAVGNRFRYFLSEIASHGFLVVAIGSIGDPRAEIDGSLRGRPSPGSPADFLAKAGGFDPDRLGPGILPAPFSTAAQLTQAIDWAVAENRRPGSPLQGRLALDRVAVMGQSCGGVQAIAAAFDPRVKTLGVWNSGLFDHPTRAFDIAAAPVNKAQLPLLKVPAIYVTGDDSDQAKKNADDDIERITGVPVFRAWREKTPHGGTYTEPSGGDFGRLATAWLRWRLMDDAEAAKTFVGPRCGLCTSPQWHVSKRGME